MFKKSLLTLALAAAATNVMAASVIISGGAGTIANPEAYTMSSEGSANDTAVDPGGVSFDLDTAEAANYVGLQSVTIDITGATLTPATSGVIALTGNASDDVSAYTVTYPTTTQAVFTFTTPAGDNNDAGVDGLTLAGTPQLDITGLVLEYAASAVGSTVSYTITTRSDVGGALIETASAVILESVTQFSTATSNFGLVGLIDVNDGRLNFVDDSSSETATVTISSASADLLNAVPVATPVEVTLNGQFSFLDTDADGAVDAGFTLSGTNATDLTSTVVTGVAAGAPASFTVATDGTIVLKDQAYDYVATLEYNTASAGASTSSYSSAASLGSWALNGSSFTVPYMPFGPNTFPILSVTHEGTVAGAIFVEYMLEGKATATTLDMNGLMVQPGITDLRAVVMDAIAADVLADSGDTFGKVSVDITINAPEDQISAFAGFKVKHPTTLSESRVAIGTFGANGDLKLTDN